MVVHDVLDVSLMVYLESCQIVHLKSLVVLVVFPVKKMLFMVRRDFTAPSISSYIYI